MSCGTCPRERECPAESRHRRVMKCLPTMVSDSALEAHQTASAAPTSLDFNRSDLPCASPLLENTHRLPERMAADLRERRRQGLPTGLARLVLAEVQPREPRVRSEGLRDAPAALRAQAVAPEDLATEQLSHTHESCLHPRSFRPELPQEAARISPRMQIGKKLVGEKQFPFEVG